MGKRRTRKPATISDQLRYFIEEGELSRYEIAKQSGVDASQLHRFVKGTGRLTTDSLDRVGKVLNLRIVIDE
jgi:plasmid maintenance system antidote protein VapI